MEDQRSAHFNALSWVCDKLYSCCSDAVGGELCNGVNFPTHSEWHLEKKSPVDWKKSNSSKELTGIKYIMQNGTFTNAFVLC